MAETMGGKQCSCFYCRRPRSLGGHNDGCPVLDPTGRAMDEWNRGYDYGFDDNHIPAYRYQNYSLAFIYGWIKGKSEIDRLVEAAYYSNYGYELEYDDEGWAIWSS